MPKVMVSLDAGHQILCDHVARASSLHLTVHILQYCPDELNYGNDEAAKRNGTQVVSADVFHRPKELRELPAASLKLCQGHVTKPCYRMH